MCEGSSTPLFILAKLLPFDKFSMMITRLAFDAVSQALSRQASVALLGPRQAGKTTLALAIAEQMPSIYIDLEDPVGRAKLADPVLFLSQYENVLVILDEIHRTPEIFQALRGLIDQGRRKGKRTGRFLLLGSASMDLLRQSGESLAGRIAYVELDPLGVREVNQEQEQRLWVRGGFPDSYLAGSDADSLEWRKDMIRTYLERDVPAFGPRIPAETLRRLWTMLAHSQGGLFNASRLASGLGVKGQTVSRYVDLLVDLLLVRALKPYQPNVGKRLTKSPKVYVRDSGLVHALLNIEDFNELSGHPVVGTSWEGFVIENLLATVPRRTQASFYRTSAGAEIDLILELPGKSGVWAVEVKHGLVPHTERGFHNACTDIEPAQTFVVHAGTDRFPLAEGVEAIGLRDMVEELAAQ